jgi:hypothetical protein
LDKPKNRSILAIQIESLIMKNVFLGIFILLSSYAIAQNRCSTTEALEHLSATNPDAVSNIAAAKKEHLQYQNNKDQQEVITIPVVIHVVYNTSTQNISDAQIMSQIAVLNKDFRKSNSDFNKIPSAFSGLAADTEIEFCLASKDELGLPTSGIIRKQTTTTSYSLNNADDVKSSSKGGSDPWSRDQYLNIWICNLSGGLLGYAYPPGISASLDGIVIGYRYFGTTGTVSSPFNLGRTTTHEVGHWLGLDHIWGSGNGCGSDNVADTPLQQSNNFGCPTFPSISICNDVDNRPNGDMFMNYMDYVNDNCMQMFSAGQSALMRSVLNTSRVSIRASLGCNTIGIKEQTSISFKLFPNPSINTVNVVLNQKPVSSDYISITSILGTEVLRIRPKLMDNKLDISHLEPGTYFISVSQNQQLQTQKVVVR